MEMYWEEIEAKKNWLVSRNKSTLEAYRKYVQGPSTEICVLQIFDQRMHREAEEAMEFNLFMLRKL